jgi:hypothetical protein
VTYLALGSVPTSRLGVDVTAAALTPLGANTGVSYKNDGQSVLVVNNASGSNVTLTPHVVGNIDGNTPPNPTIVIPTGKTWLVGAFSKSDYTATDGTGNIYVDFSASTSVSAGVVHTPFVP